MPTVITFGIQKGGCSKSTTTGLTAFLLADQGYRVLAVDMDSQGNLGELLTGEPTSFFRYRTAFEAMKEGDATAYRLPLSDKLHVLPSDALMALLPRYIYTELPSGRDPKLVLKEALEPIADNYDYILIDTPPALGDATVNALSASDHVVVLFEPSRFCYTAVPEFFDVVELVKESANPKLNTAGILRNLNDVRRSEMKSYNEVMYEDYPDLVFNTIITRKAATGRIGIEGLSKKNPEYKEAVAPYLPFVEELKKRCPVSM